MLGFAASVTVVPRRGGGASATSARRPPVALAGFGAKGGGAQGGAKGGSGGARKPKRARTIRATYRELVDRGCTEFVCYARAEGGGDAGWRRVGTVVAEGDDVCVAVANSKRAVLEHAKRLHPQLGMVRVLEVGFGRGGEDADMPVACGRTEETCTSAFTPDAVTTPFYVQRKGDGRAMPVDTTSLKSTGGVTFPPRKRGEGKTPSDS